MSESIGLAIIAKNEQDRLPHLLESISGAFDQVVLYDTGSEDLTIPTFKTWCLNEQQKQPGFTGTVGQGEWHNDFSRARTEAHALLDTDWEVWADCDDIIVGAQNLRGVVEQSAPQIVGYIAGYNYTQHPQTGGCVTYLKRERLVRKGMSRWVNRVHEAQIVDGPCMELPSTVAEWVHRKQMYEQLASADSRRNLDILEAWVQDEPENTRVLAYLGTENLARSEAEAAMAYFQQYLALDPEWDEERAQVHRRLAICYLQFQKYDDAIQCAFDAMQVLPSWTDSYLTLAEACYAKGEFAKALEWAREALRRGEPKTLLIINPLDYTYQVRKVLAGALGALGQIEEAIEHGAAAWQENPSDMDLAHQLMAWRGALKREQTAVAVATLAQQLIAHDEQWKALHFLENCVPHFVDDHPGVVQLRSELRSRLQWLSDPRSLLDHYATGGSKPEDFLPDDKCDEVAASLPRVQFLYAGMHDQLLAHHHEGLVTGAQDQIEAAIATLAPEEEVSDWTDALHDDRRIT